MYTKIYLSCFQLVALLHSNALAFQKILTVSVPQRSALHSTSDSAGASMDPFDNYAPGSELVWRDTKIGGGQPVEEGDALTVAYKGYLWSSKKKFGDSDSLVFKLGGGSVMPGFDLGVQGMQEGGKRTILIPPSCKEL